jgi:hypothetical protein
MKTATPKLVVIYDAIIKRDYLLKYNLKPLEVDSSPALMLKIWSKISECEMEKKNLG